MGGEKFQKLQSDPPPTIKHKRVQLIEDIPSFHYFMYLLKEPFRQILGVGICNIKNKTREHFLDYFKVRTYATGWGLDSFHCFSTRSMQETTLAFLLFSNE